MIYIQKRSTRFGVLIVAAVLLLNLIPTISSHNWLHALISLSLGIGLILFIVTFRYVIAGNNLTEEYLGMRSSIDCSRIIEMSITNSYFNRVLVLQLNSGEKKLVNVFSCQKSSTMIYELYKKLPDPHAVIIAEKLLEIIKEERMLEGPHKDIALEQKRLRKEENRKKIRKTAFWYSTLLAFSYLAWFHISGIVQNIPFQINAIPAMILVVVCCYAVFMPILMFIISTTRGDLE